MSIEKLKKWNVVSIVVIVVFCVIHLAVMTAIAYSAFQDTFLTGASPWAIKLIGITPVVVIFAAILVRVYCVSKIKKSELEGRLKALEEEVALLKKQ